MYYLDLLFCKIIDKQFCSASLLHTESLKVMRLHSITSDEYDSRTLEGDRSIYLSQPITMFEPTRYDERVVNGLGLITKNCRTNSSRENSSIKEQAVTGQARDNCWRDEDPNAVF